MNKIKIVHVVPTFELGGVQTGILRSLKELNNVYEYKVLVISRVDKEWLKNISPHLREHILNTGYVNMLWGWFKAYRMLQQLKPEFLICSLWKSVIVCVTYKLFNPGVYFFGFFHVAFPNHILGNFFLKLMAVVQHSALADSNETKLFLETRYNVSKVHVIPYNFGFGKNSFIRNKLDPSCIRMVYFGRLTTSKGIERSLEFCRLCKEAGIKFTYDLFGEDAKGNSKHYAELIKRLGLEKNVIIKKTVPPNIVLEKMYQYDFLLQLSNMEGMALSVVEAMNCGLVPIVTPVGEIGRYSKDLVNAIWLDREFDSNLQILIIKLKKVMADPALYSSISLSASCTFTHYKKYCEAMIEAIDQQREMRAAQLHGIE